MVTTVPRTIVRCSGVSGGFTASVWRRNARDSASVAEWDGPFAAVGHSQIGLFAALASVTYRAEVYRVEPPSE